MRTAISTVASSKSSNVSPSSSYTRGCGCALVEQLAQLTNSSLWPRVAEVRYATVGNGAIDGFIQKICRKRRLPCVRLGHSDAGSELNTLAPLHAFCREHNKDFVAYIHDKGSFHKSQSNTNLRRTLLRALASEGCYDAVTRKNTSPGSANASTGASASGATTGWGRARAV